MFPAGDNVKDGVKGSRLTGGGQHGRGSPLQGADLGRHVVIRGVLEAGVEVAVGLQVKELTHVLAGGVFERGGLDDGDLPGLSVSRGIAALDTLGIDLIITHKISFFLMGHGGQDRPNIWGIVKLTLPSAICQVAESAPSISSSVSTASPA